MEKDFIVWQKAEVWYKGRVTAPTEEKALEMANNGEVDDWELDLSTAVYSENIEIEEYK